jgi:hypothetical protein
VPSWSNVAIRSAGATKAGLPAKLDHVLRQRSRESTCRIARARMPLRNSSCTSQQWRVGVCVARTVAACTNFISDGLTFARFLPRQALFEG